MKLIELLKLCKNLLKFMSENDLKAEDYKYVSMYEKYVDMRNNGDKVDYILLCLSNEYKLSESTIKRIIRRLSKEAKC